MTNSEFARLMGYYKAALNAPHSRAVSRRSAKAKRTATGQVGLKSARILHDCHIETVYRYVPVDQR